MKSSLMCEKLTQFFKHRLQIIPTVRDAKLLTSIFEAPELQGISPDFYCVFPNNSVCLLKLASQISIIKKGTVRKYTYKIGFWTTTASSLKLQV